MAKKKLLDSSFHNPKVAGSNLTYVFWFILKLTIQELPHPGNNTLILTIDSPLTILGVAVSNYTKAHNIPLHPAQILRSGYMQ